MINYTRTSGENASGHIPRIVVGITALIIVMIAYTGVVGAQGMDVTFNSGSGEGGAGSPHAFRLGMKA